MHVYIPRGTYSWYVDTNVKDLLICIYGEGKKNVKTLPLCPKSGLTYQCLRSMPVNAYSHGMTPNP